jgi:hypothetical protein
MGAITDRFKAAKEHWQQRRRERDETKPERAQRRAQARAIRLEHKRRGDGPGDPGGGI